MALRLADYFQIGEFFETTNYGVRFIFQLRDMELPVTVDLVGTPHEGLQGRYFSFEARDEDAVLPVKDLKVHPQQVGSVGTMEYKMVRTYDLETRQHGPEVPRLYLEWYGQNGRTVLELLNPKIEMMTGDPLEPRPLPPRAEQGSLEVEIIRRDEDDNIEITRRTYGPDNDDEGRQAAADRENLDVYLEALNREKESAVHAATDAEDPLAEEKLMDYLIDNEPGELIGSLFEPKQLPPPSEVQNEEKAYDLVLQLVAEMALCGVGLHICKHFTMVRTYQFLIEELIPEERFHPQLRNTGWVMHYMTHEYCEECEAEPVVHPEGFEPQ